MELIDQVTVGEKLGVGMFGTTYLAKLKSKTYALKIQHILEKEKIKDFKNSLWRELDLYEYIGTLNASSQVFFTKLYGYKIYGNCTHVQSRPWVVNTKDKKDKFAQKIKKLDKSEWCVKYLLEYKGTITLEKFLQNKIPSEKLIYSILLQICNIVLILHQGGYSHGDLHQGNIMITPTNKKYFTVLKNKIPYCGFQLSAIDYGEVSHKKFGKYKESNKDFMSDPIRFAFEEMFNTTCSVTSNFFKYIADCKKANKKLPWEKNPNCFSDGTKKIIQSHKEFYLVTKHKYLLIYPKASELFDLVEAKISSEKDINSIVAKKPNEKDFWSVLDRIIYEFELFFPKVYSKYNGWCSYWENLLPVDKVLTMLSITNLTDYVGFFVKQIE